MSLKDLIPWLKRERESDRWPYGGDTTLDVEPKRSRKKTALADHRDAEITAPDAKADAFFADARRDMERVFDEFPRHKDFASLAARAAGAQGLNIEDLGHAYRVTLDLPEINEKDIAIAVENNQLIVSGETHSERREGDASRGFHETFVGRFQRRVVLEGPVDQEKHTHTFASGRLQITLPKK